MSGRIVLGSRSSALARLQTCHVAAALKRHFKGLVTEYYFKESLGDKDLETPLWQMGDRGVFTRDLTEDLIARKVDAVVHSYKDLEIEKNEATHIISVLPRADVRDVILLKKDWQNSASDSILKIYSSSPRRQYNIAQLLPRILPVSRRPASIEFSSIRGNIQTRLAKYMEQDGQGFVIAKAALDRIMAEDFEESAQDDYQAIRQQIGEVLAKCDFMVLPLSENPCAPAQGAFAVEMRSDDFNVLEKVERLVHSVSERSVQVERNILAAYGGGCHQKIGAANLILGNKNVSFVKGQTDAGEVLNKVIIESGDQRTQYSIDNWPDQNWETPQSSAMFWEQSPVHPQACEYAAEAGNTPYLCVKTVADWAQLAQKDIWVHSSADGLGWSHAPDLQYLIH